MLSSLLVVLASTEQPCAEVGNHISIRYTGSIHSLSAAGTPGNVYDEGAISFVVGRGEVILGMDEGVIGACVGATRTLVIPPEKGYGEAGLTSHERDGKWWDGIPGFATLQIVLEVMAVHVLEDKISYDDMFATLDANGDRSLSREEVMAYFKQVHEHDHIPDDLWEDDVDGDGYISWEEFSGPKGAGARDEL